MKGTVWNFFPLKKMCKKRNALRLEPTHQQEEKLGERSITIIQLMLIFRGVHITSLLRRGLFLKNPI
jgi:hypothetical protein